MLELAGLVVVHYTSLHVVISGLPHHLHNFNISIIFSHFQNKDNVAIDIVFSLGIHDSSADIALSAGQTYFKPVVTTISWSSILCLIFSRNHLPVQLLFF